MSQSLDEICPPYYGEDRLDLSLTTQGRVRAFTQTSIAVSYARTLPEGVLLPLEMIVQGPSAQSYVRRVYSRSRPTTLFFTPKEGGSHLILLREFAHNRWWGRVAVTVDGPLLDAPRPI
jgi:hypothetical protein